MEFVLLPIGIVLLFYLILLRPVLNQQRAHRRDISALEVGDEVLTAGGFFATVREINTRDEGPLEIVLEAAPGVLLRATPAAVSQVVRRAAAASADEEGSA
ncbi:MAG: preprotein translocase subunit YajC [Chloroflexi bacterium]|nr:preprotein translocase subunit YajC [Chloroflexota bacterium]